MPKITPLGLLNPDRLVLIPKKFQAHHEFCFHLHDRIADLLIEYEMSGAHLWIQDSFDKALLNAGNTDPNIDLLEFLKSNGLSKEYEHHIVAHLVLGLTSDMLHFLYEALICFERRKFAVGFSLLRKPLKENLLFLSWLLADSNDFITRFEKNNFTTLNDIRPEQRLQIINNAINHLATKEAFAADLLVDMIFSKNQPRGFEPVWQRATHLITKHGALLKTEDMNINFIFHDHASDDLFDHLYANLPYIMLYVVQVALECFSKILKANDKTVSHLIISSMGAFECLFLEGNKRNVTSMLSRELKPFLKCIHCSAEIKLSKVNAIDMYLKELLTCQKCSLSSPFPLYWLMTQSKMTISSDSENIPILQKP